MASWQEGTLNTLKGDIGELIVKNFLKYQYEVDVFPGVQKFGVDYQIPRTFGDGYDNVDVKLSDKLDEEFTMAYRNDGNLRHPWRDNCKADDIIVVTFDFQEFAKQCSQKVSLTIEEIEEEIDSFCNTDFSIIKARCEKEKNDYQEVCLTLLICHRTKKRLQEDKDFKDTQELLDNYVHSICAIKTRALKEIGRRLEGCRPGYQVFNNGKLEVGLEGRDFGFVRAVISWDALDRSDYEVLFNRCHEVFCNKFETIIKKTTWPYEKGKFGIPFDRWNQQIQSFAQSELEWLVNELERGGTFHKKVFGLEYKDKKRLIETLECLLIK